PSPIFDRFLGYGFSGRITSLAVDPTSPSVIYAGAANGGVWKTTDGGLHWSPMSGESTLPGLSIGSIAIDPLSPNLIYAGGGEPNGTGYVGRGVYKSSNGGASWALLGGGGNPFASPMVTYRVLVGTNHQVWVAWSGGLHRSSDGGTTWVRVKGGLPKTGAVLDLAMSADGTELLAVVQSRGLFRSADSGTTWTQITAGVPTDVGGPRARLAIAPSNRLIAYLIEGEIDGGNTYFSTNGGASWSPMNPSVPVSTTYGGYTLEVAVDPRNPNVVYAAGLDLAVNSGGTTGGTWANVRPFTHADHHAFAFPPCAAAPCPYYLGNDGGVFFLQPQGSPASAAFGDRNRNL
ncbi:MAG TPA: hypothetical protein PK413_22020, partial [Thermoanaerobaculia bacterium]|nr:hypothetical protein [Thermoanaerobaculia bacterium]